MGIFSVAISLGSPDGQRWANLDALVDTGASMCAMPESVLRGLGVPATRRRRFRFGQGEVREMEIGQTWVRVAGEQVFTSVMFNAEGTPALLGAMALEDAFLGVDPVAKRLIPVDGFVG